MKSIVLCTFLQVRSVKSYTSIPQPKGLPFIGAYLDYTRFGRFGVEKYHEALDDRHRKYGPLVKERIADRTIVHIFEPDDARTVFANEGKIPHIAPLQETALLYRKMKDMSLGLGNMNGEEWYRLRNAVQRLMMRPKEVQNFLPLAEKAANDFVDFVRKNRNSVNQLGDIDMLVRQWSLDSSGNVVFEKNLNCVGKNDPNSWSCKMVTANQVMFKLSGELKFSLPIYKYIATPKWKELVAVEDYFYGEGQRLVDEAIGEIQNMVDRNDLDTNKFTFLKYLMTTGNLSHKDVSIIALSLFGDGLNTTAPTFLFNLFCLAKNEEAQKNARKEVQGILADFKDEQLLTPNDISKMSYLKACIKETFRLYPNGTDIVRIPQTDLVLSDYHIPKGTEVNINMSVNFRKSQYFNDPDSFVPERWLRSAATEKVHPFLLLPFGHGTRMCAGRRFAEQDLVVLLAKLLNEFKIEHNGELAQKMLTLLVPDGSLDFRFINL